MSACPCMHAFTSVLLQIGMSVSASLCAQQRKRVVVCVVLRV